MLINGVNNGQILSTTESGNSIDIIFVLSLVKSLSPRARPFHPPPRTFAVEFSARKRNNFGDNYIKYLQLVCSVVFGSILLLSEEKGPKTER